MRKLLISFIGLLPFCSAGFAQDNQAPSQKTTPPPATTTEQPKSEVDRMLEDAKTRGELILGTCLENCDDARVLDGVEGGRALELPKPVYPAVARMAHASGEVQVKLIIGPDGTVIAASAISGHPLLQATCVKAARESRFAPTTYNGEPVKVVGVITYNFFQQ